MNGCRGRRSWHVTFGHPLGMELTPWSNQFVLASRARSLDRSHELQQMVRRGELVRVSRGVYRHAWAITNDPERRADDEYIARIRAAQLRSEERLVVSGLSAAAVWDLPIVGTWPTLVSVASEREVGGRSNAHLARSYVGYPPPVVERGGLVTTSLARTVADVARVETMERAVAIADAALRGQKAAGGRAFRAPISKAAVATELESLNRAPGAAKARGVLSFADGKSGSAGESCSRVGVWKLGLPSPVLQEAFYDDEGFVGYVDFWWPGCKLIGEFDGRGKYLRDEYTAGRSTATIVLLEKEREDRLRALGFRVVRWDWATALDLRLLEAKLRGAGLQ